MRHGVNTSAALREVRELRWVRRVRKVRKVRIPAGDASHCGDMVLPAGFRGLVLFALLTAQGEQTDLDTREHRFNIPLLARRMQDAAAFIRELRGPLDIFMVRKLGVPGHEKSAMGAIAIGGVKFLHPTPGLNVRPEAIAAVVGRVQAELLRREHLYRKQRPAISLKGRTVLVGDGGLATGSTMQAAVLAIRQQLPLHLAVAMPVGALLEGLRAHLQPLTGDSRQSNGLRTLIGWERFALLGEASHGRREFCRARAEITKRLINEKNFTAVAVEADWPDAWRVNRYVCGLSDDADADADAALADFQRFPAWIWRHTVMRECLPDSWEDVFHRTLHRTGTTRFLWPLRDDAALSWLVAPQRLQCAIDVIYRPDTERHRTPQPPCLHPLGPAVRCRDSHRQNQRCAAAGRGPGVDRRRGARDLSVRCLTIQELR